MPFVKKHLPIVVLLYRLAKFRSDYTWYLNRDCGRRHSSSIFHYLYLPSTVNQFVQELFHKCIFIYGINYFIDTFFVTSKTNYCTYLIKLLICHNRLVFSIVEVHFSLENSVVEETFLLFLGGRLSFWKTNFLKKISCLISLLTIAKKEYLALRYIFFLVR